MTMTMVDSEADQIARELRRLLERIQTRIDTIDRRTEALEIERAQLAEERETLSRHLAAAGKGKDHE